MSDRKPFSRIDKIGFIAKHNIADYGGLICEMAKLLEKEGRTVFFDQHTSPLVPGSTVSTNTEILNKARLIVVLGGDGTLLTIARSIPKRVVHILSVNTGTLGFLTEIDPERAVNALKRSIDGNYVLDERSLLRVTWYKEGKKLGTKLALNDAVITQGAKARLIDLPVAINQRQVNRYQADGLIIATPTGSTGHSLSAGGPIVHPKLNAIILTPICPLSLANRPIVLPNDRQINVSIETFRDQHESVTMTIDGQICVPLEYHTEIKIRRSSRKLYLVRMTGGNYYRKLRGKLNWG